VIKGKGLKVEGPYLYYFTIDFFGAVSAEHGSCSREHAALFQGEVTAVVTNLSFFLTFCRQDSMRNRYREKPHWLYQTYRRSQIGVGKNASMRYFFGTPFAQGSRSAALRHITCQ
jgi:hypothetical protein